MIKVFSKRTINTILKEEDTKNIAEFLLYLANVKDNSTWGKRCELLLCSILDIMVYFRDEKDQEITINNIFKNLSLDKIIEMKNDNSIPEKLKRNLINYIQALPDYKEPTPENPNPELPDCFFEQHGYSTMQLRSLTIYE